MNASATNSGGNTRIDFVHLLRGFAAILVVLEHIIGRPGYEAFNRLFGFLDGWGHGGVAAFFVISGLVLPLSLGREYRLQGFPRFLLRRIVRIEPTYLASVVIACICIAAVSRVAPNGQPWTPALKQLSLHTMYLIPFSSYEWILPVYWTLAVEFQFYIAIGLLFPAFAYTASYSKALPTILCMFIGLLSFIACFLPQISLLKYISCFSMGMTVACGMLFLPPKTLTYSAILVSAGVGIASGLPADVSIFSVLASFACLNFTSDIDAKSIFVKPFWLLGTISYSLYIIHQLVASLGETTAKLIIKVAPGELAFYLSNTIPVISFGLSLIAGWLLYVAVERPTHRYSRQFSKCSRDSVAVSA